MHGRPWQRRQDRVIAVVGNSRKLPRIYADERGSKAKVFTAKDAKERKGEGKRESNQRRDHRHNTGVRDEAVSLVHDAWVTLVSSGADPSPSHQIADASCCSSRSARDSMSRGAEFSEKRDEPSSPWLGNGRRERCEERHSRGRLCYAVLVEQF